MKKSILNIFEEYLLKNREFIRNREARENHILCMSYTTLIAKKII